MLSPANDICRTHGSRLARHFTPLMEQCQGWNAANIELRSKLLLGFGIDLEQAYPGLELGGGLLKRRRHHLAGSAPGRPEIHQQRDLVTLDMFLESRRCYLQRLSVKQRLVTFAAIGYLWQTRRGDAVGSTAMGTNKVQWIIHFHIS